MTDTIADDRVDSYAEMLARRRRATPIEGRIITDDDMHPSLLPHQRHIVKWAVAGSRRAVWADTGLGKTRIQVEWARLSAPTSLIVAPLAVCDQTVREAQSIGVDAAYVTSPGQITGPGVWVTNYERVAGMPPDMFGAVVLDESSILKQSDGRTRTMLIEHFRDVPHRLACTATPGPNDPEELTNHAEFLGHMSRNNMLAAYFVHDQDGWRLKGHAAGPMVRWMNTWAMAVRRPSDLGYDDTGYILPPPIVIPQIVHADIKPDEGELFAAAIGGVTGRSRVRRETLDARCRRAADLVAAEPSEPWLIWCELNDEAEKLTSLIPGAVNVHGGMTPEQKADALRGFADGTIQVLVTKPKIASFGLNWQHCARMAFVGLSDSYEAYYQCIRRCHRYGQRRQVHAYIVLSDMEQTIAANVKKKESRSNTMLDLMIGARKVEAS